ncbi:ribonuclease H-like protein [Lentithecium fluviatile CBS 122367]|uniref:Ribonuclease H-like protein n=1 Tax=Lentithecium fluviatile CBS 122367 TaxID=1168545 RepID=A0A6G1JNX3_9PLEO|nr:ribonuclease H-like protein [Lentithecium fluviatile CBS 122367]
MGIKNLAFCVGDVKSSTITGESSMEVTSWRRLDLTDQALRSNVEKNLDTDVVTEAGGKDTDPFAPEFLSQTAYWLLRRNLLYYEPDVVLIERQRWRSSSSSAIQQWTVRVNSLEAMLWAVFTTLQAEFKLLPERERKLHKRPMFMFAVDPKRVSSYWLGEDSIKDIRSPSRASGKEELIDEGDLEAEDGAGAAPPPEAGSKPAKKVTKSLATKKAKIQLLRAWLEANKTSTTGSDPLHRPTVNLSFRDQGKNPRVDAETTRQTVLYYTDPPSERSKRTQIRKDDAKKVDDLTDCLLQAAAWVAWEDSRRLLRLQFNEFGTELEEKLGRKLITWDCDNLVYKAVGGMQGHKGTKELEEETGIEETKEKGEAAAEKKSKVETNGLEELQEAVAKKSSKVGTKIRKKAVKGVA